MKYDIFISYRREGGDTLAQLIYDRLVSRGYQVFLDIESLRSGKFNEKLLEVIEECQDVILILPPDALERCSNPGDWVYEEISHALKHKKNIIPVMLQGFEWPSPMPEGLEELPNFNGIRDSKEYFDAVIEKMTGLLKSKPVLFGNFRNKLDEKKKSFSLGGWLRKHKKLVCCLSALVLVLAALGIWVFGFGGLQKEPEDMVWFRLSPTEDTSVAAYRDSLELLEERVRVLTDGYEYEWKEKDAGVEIAIPWELVPEGDIKWLIRAWLSRPMKLYLFGSVDDEFSVDDSEVYLLLEKEDIQASVYGKGRPDVLDPSLEGFETEEDYYYLQLTLTEDARARMQDTLGDVERYFLGYDLEAFPGQFYYYNLTPSSDGTCFYSTDDWQMENLFALTAHNWKSEALPGGFTFQILYPSEWEMSEEIASPGVNQVNYEDLTGELATFQFITSSEVTDGEYMDAQSILKSRLDTLQVPYAIGHIADLPYSLSIRMGVEHMSADIVDMLLDSVYVFVEPSCGQSYQVQQLEICPLDDGSYAMEAVFADYYQTMVQEMTEKALEAGQDRLYLTVDSIRLASAPLTEPITDGRVRFTNLEWYGKETISEEDCYLLEFIQECVEGTDMPYMGYYLDFVWTEAEEMSYGLLLEKAKEMEEKMTAAVEAICPGAEVYRNSTYWSIHLNLPLDEKLPETAMTMIQEMYENCYMENGEYGSSFYIYPCEDALSFYCYFSENTDTYAMQYTGYCTGEVMRPYQDTVRRLEEESTFFGEAVQATEYSAGFVFE